MAKGKSGRKTVSRRLPNGYDRRPLKSYTPLLGEAIWAWNQLHEAFWCVFLNVVDRDNPYMGMSIWQVLPSEGAQRDALEAAIRACGDRLTNRERAALLWAIKRASDLTRYRNDLVHGISAWLAAEKGTLATPAPGPNPLARSMRYSGREDHDGRVWEGPSLNGVAKGLRGDAMQLCGYVFAVLLKVAGTTETPLPRRPTLQLHDYVQAASGQPRPKRRATKRRSRPRSSGG